MITLLPLYKHKVTTGSVQKKSVKPQLAPTVCMLFLFLFFSPALVRGDVVITAPVNGSTICSYTAANGSAPAWTTLGSIIITEGATTDFPKNKSSKTITLTAPSGWVFNTGVTPGIAAAAGQDISAITLAVTNSTTLTITWTTPNAGGDDGTDIITITGLQVQASTTASTAGPIYCSALSQTVAGLAAGTQVTGTAFAGLALITSPAIITQPSDQSVTAGTGIATFTVAVSNGVTYQWQESTDGGSTWNNASNGGVYSGTTTTSLTLTNPPIGMDTYRYRCIVTGACTPVATSDGNATLSVTMAYCSSGATSVADEEIFSVTFNGATNTYACGTVAPGPGSILNEYSNFTTLGSLSSVMQGQTVAFSIAEDECDGATYYSNGCAIWIDLNQDSDFDDAGEKVFVEAATTAGPRTINGSITIPVTALPGTTRMRVVVVESASGAGLTACGTYSYGETEDYLITITSCTPAIPSCATTPSPANASAGQSTCITTLTWTAPASTGCDGATSYDVYFGTAATPPFVVNTTTTSYSTGTTLTPNTTYYWKIVPKNASGNASSCATWSFTTNASLCLNCLHTIRLTDTYSDGWDGGAVTVTVNGTPVLTNITLPSGGGPLDFTFSAATGDVINVTRTIDGSYPSEMRVELIAGTGSTNLARTQPLTTPGSNASGCCTATVPGAATSPTPAHAATAVNPCSLELLWTAPVAGACNACSSYDIYFGTTATPPFLLNQTGATYALPNALADNTTYYWSIVPKNGAGPAVACPVWSFTTGSTTNPAYCFYGNALNYPSGGSNCAQLTSPTATQNGCAWNRNLISFASAFDYSVNMYFGASAGGADGCAFVFQNSPEGISQCGSNGGQLGAGGISNAVVIEFDTYDNDSPSHIYDMAADHTAIEIDGDLQSGTPLAGPVQADPLDGLLADGLLHNLRVTWNPATTELCVYVDASQRLCCTYDFINNVFGGNSNAFWGFTGSTGLLSNQQYFCPITLPLPVTLVDFTASCQDGLHQIDWYTATETNNDYFTLERSKDGTHFTLAAEIDGAGNSNELRHYLWNDTQPNEGRLYYRLSQTDYDGNTEIFPIQTVMCSEDPESLNIQLVMAANQTVVTAFEVSVSDIYTLEVFDLLGRKVTSMSSHFEKGVNHMDLIAPTLKQGLYVLSIHNSYLSAVRKFIVY